MTYPAIYAVAWVALDCLIAWSWVFVPGADSSRAWFGVTIATLALLAWVLAYLWTRRSAVCALGIILCLPVALASVAPIDWASFSISALERPAQAWAMANVLIGGAFAVAALTPREARWWRAGAPLAFGAVYSWLYSLQVFVCGHSQPLEWVCTGLLGSGLRGLLTAVAVATLVVMSVALATRPTRER